MATKPTDGRRGNKNAAKWVVDDDMVIHESIAPLRAKGLSDRAATRKIAQDRKIYSRLPQPGGPHHILDSEERRFSRIIKRLQSFNLILARALMPHIPTDTFEKLANDTGITKLQNRSPSATDGE